MWPYSIPSPATVHLNAAKVRGSSQINFVISIFKTPNIYNHKKLILKNDAKLDTKQILPPPVCECWIKSRESSLFPCPYGRCLPTSPCSSHLPDCMFWMCSSRGLCPPARGDTTKEMGLILLPGNQNHPDETLGTSKINDISSFFISADWSVCIFRCIAFMEHPKLCQ